MTSSRCKIDGCDKFQKTKGYCSIHLKELLPEEHRKFYDEKNRIRKERYLTDEIFRERTKANDARRQREWFWNHYNNDPEWKEKQLKAAKIRIKGLRKRIRLQVLNHYCNNNIRCMCKGCNEKYVEFMSIDHMNGNGNKHRKELLGKGITIYIWLLRNNFPKGYRVLCHNCNISLGHYGYCPHEENVRVNIPTPLNFKYARYPVRPNSG